MGRHVRAATLVGVAGAGTLSVAVIVDKTLGRSKKEAGRAAPFTPKAGRPTRGTTPPTQQLIPQYPH